MSPAARVRPETDQGNSLRDSLYGKSLCSNAVLAACAYGRIRFHPFHLFRASTSFFWHFSDISSGMALGPEAVASWTVRSLCASVTASRRGRQLASLIGLLLGLPFKFVDYLTRRSLSAIDSAGGVYFYGQKQMRVISDREIIRLYRGGF
jgi:hypothetical protein